MNPTRKAALLATQLMGGDGATRAKAQQEIEDALSALQSQRQLTEEEKKRALGWAEECGLADKRADELEHRAKQAEAIARTTKGVNERLAANVESAEHRAESLQRQVSEYREALLTIDAHIGLEASNSTEAEIRREVHLALTPSSTPEQGT